MASSYLQKHMCLLKRAKTCKVRMQDQNTETPAVQQSDYLKEFMLEIVDNGLACAYEIYGKNPPGPAPPTRAAANSTLPEPQSDVIIVGAGVAGLAAAYELKRAGFSVKILEQTDRIGGRVFTYPLGRGLYGEAGAMRLPGGVDEPNNRPHFLTDAYIQKFGLPIKQFPNYDPNGISNIYNLKAKTTEWDELYFTTVWSQWKDGIKGEMIEEIQNIGQYYEKTTGVVTDQLIHRLEAAQEIEEEIEVWENWINIWSQFTLESFLEANIDVIKAKVPLKDQCDLDLVTLRKLLPWSNDAVRGYSVSTYTIQLDVSLVVYLRDQLGHWWSENMHALVGGMHQFPTAFYQHLEEDVEFHRQVSKISYHSSFQSDNPDQDRVVVTCYGEGEQSENIYTANAVILSTPINVLRQIEFKPFNVNDEDEQVALRKSIQAFEDMFTAASTKIFLRTKTRFWEKAPYFIEGGFSKTNLPIGQIHYVKPDPDFVDETEQGIILIYTWKSEALIFGSLTTDQVRQEAIEQISVIHPEITDQVEACVVHAWYDQPSYQGAFGLLKTTQFNNIRYLWEPMGPVHFAGESISFASGWIQGSLESGLKSAYQVYAHRQPLLEE